MAKNEERKYFKLPESCLLGAATASVQIEGGDRNNSWYRWSSEQGRISDGTTCLEADDHWNRIDEDIKLMTKLHLQGYRMSLEWSRIEPSPGEFDSEAMNHYRGEIEKLREAGIRPVVTLHHFSNPIWLEDRGAWTNDGVIEAFSRYVEYVAKNIGDLVEDWVTINEPNVYLSQGYIEGNWPPGTVSLKKYLAGARYMIGAHISAYRCIHAIRKAMNLGRTRVGIAFHLGIFEPDGGAGSRLAAHLLDRYFHEIFITGMATGKLLRPVGKGYPYGKGLFLDFFGVNYYSRDMVSFAPSRPGELFGKLSVKEGAPVNDLGWEIYPEGLYRVCRRYYERFKLPVIITENGTCDAEDAFRAPYIVDHLYQVKRLVDDGVDVQGYYHWSLMDNFEWAYGLSARFGLYKVDYSSQKRILRNSGKLYGEICKQREVTEKMIKKYCPKEC